MGGGFSFYMHVLIRPSTSALQGWPYHHAHFTEEETDAQSGEVFAQSPSASKGPTWLLNLNSTTLSPSFFLPKEG